MSWIQWLRQQWQFRRHSDAFSRDRPALWRAIRNAIDSQLHQGTPVWLLCHFTDTYEKLQLLLENWRVDYEVVDRPIEPRDLELQRRLNPARVQLLLARLLDPSVEWGSFRPEGRLSLIVTERHPWLVQDQRIIECCKQLPLPTELGFFMALDDDLLQDIVNDTALTILEQLGMDRHDLITSTMISRRLERKLRNQVSDFTSDQLASSASVWERLNRHANPQ